MPIGLSRDATMTLSAVATWIDPPPCNSMRRNSGAVADDAAGLHLPVGAELLGRQVAGRQDEIGGEGLIAVVVAIAQRRRRAELAHADVPGRTVRIDEIPSEIEIAPHRLRAVGVAARVPRGPQPVDVGVMEEKDRVARRQVDLRHVSADGLMHAVMRIELKLGLGAETALPLRGRAVLAARARAAERFEVRARHDARHHLAADHVVGEAKIGGAGPRMIERIGVAVARRERRRELPVGGPVPVWQREIALARQLANDALEGKDVGAMPRQEVPVAVRAEIAVDVGEADPVAPSDCGSAFIAATARLIAARSGSPADMPRTERRVTATPCAVNCVDAPIIASDDVPAIRNPRRSSMKPLHPRGEEVSKPPRQTNSSGANVSARGYRDWLA